jgi:hypothetical protein
MRRKILNVARRDQLTAEQVQKRFGVSRVTFYKWRGPVGRGRRPYATGRVDATAIERDVRAMVRRALPGIIRQEMDFALKQFARTKRF